MNPAIACRLIHASRLAYAIAENGQGFQATDGINPDDEMTAAGFDPATLKTYQSPNEQGIDACYYGETTQGEAVLAFRGTLPPTLHGDEADFFRILLDWLNDAKIQQVPGKNLPGLVHKGFLDSLDNLWPGILAFDMSSAKPLYITGHSKGGGLAFLAAARILGQFKHKPTGIYTYAGPRVGNQEFALAYDASLKAITQRYEYQDDIVPHLPPHTGSWHRAFVVGQAAANKAVPIIPSAAATPKANFDALIRRIGQILRKIEDHSELLENYVSVGTLQFINWDNPPEIESDSWALNIRRDLHLAELLLTFHFAQILQDHSSDGGYLTSPCGLPPVKPS